MLTKIDVVEREYLLVEETSEKAFASRDGGDGKRSRMVGAVSCLCMEGPKEGGD